MAIDKTIWKGEPCPERAMENLTDVMREALYRRRSSKVRKVSREDYLIEQIEKAEAEARRGDEQKRRGDRAIDRLEKER